MLTLKQHACALLLVLLAFSATAHQPGLSTLLIQLRTNVIDGDMIVSWQEVEELMPMDGDHDKTLSDAEFSAAKAHLTGLAQTAVELESDGHPLTLLKTEVLREETTGIRFLFQWQFPPTKVLLVRSEIIHELQGGHRQIVSVRGATNALLAEYAMTRDRDVIEVPLEAGAERHDQSIGAFLWLGVEHILTGWDHLTFLFGLLVVGGRGREVAKIITSFTLAHSLTLALATFNLIRLPSSLVEAVIAASIVYVGVENIVRKKYGGRWALTFAFGMIHGCGFATALRDLGVGVNGSSVLKPLVCFNLGVEFGQLAIAAAVLPWIWKFQPRFGRSWIVGASAIVIAIGGWFLLERTVL